MGTINHIKTSAVADGGDTSLVRPSDWNSAHAYTLQDAVSFTGNTAGVMSNVSSGTLYLAGGNNVTLSQNGNSVSISAGGAWCNSYENIPGEAFSQTQTVGQSVSVAAAFYLPQPGSFSFFRFPATMTTNSTTVATTGATMSASCAMYSTWNAVVYSLGGGANSKSLQSVASGSTGYTWMNSISVAVNGTQASYSQFFTAAAEGGLTSTSTQYSISNTNYSFVTTAIHSLFTGGRFIDVNFNNTLTAGEYWIIFGLSTSSATNSTGMQQASVCRVAYGSHYGASQGLTHFGVMGSTNLTSGGLLGAGSFSTGGAAGTTASLDISAISSSASGLRPYFQFLLYS